ncbi:hypothetical protein VNO77_19134 [Canavalia gladiata]|uniref:Uncharacterized protein n=1 Tax=Canavalia gladiata TaxID=3824 RepID=A0AAN9QK90_CANGL
MLLTERLLDAPTNNEIGILSAGSDFLASIGHQIELCAQRNSNAGNGLPEKHIERPLVMYMTQTPSIRLRGLPPSHKFSSKNVIWSFHDLRSGSYFESSGASEFSHTPPEFPKAVQVK